MAHEKERELLEKFAKYWNSILVPSIEDSDIDSFLATLTKKDGAEETIIEGDISKLPKLRLVKVLNNINEIPAIKSITSFKDVGYNCIEVNDVIYIGSAEVIGSFSEGIKDEVFGWKESEEKKEKTPIQKLEESVNPYDQHSVKKGHERFKKMTGRL